MKIRPESTEDIAAIHALVAAAFGREDEADLVDQLRKAGDATISLVAEEDGVIVGHVMFSPMRAPHGALGLAPVSTAPDKQRQGIGSMLVREGLARARAMGTTGVIVLGNPDYYPRFGFDSDRADQFESPWKGPFLMAVDFGSLPEGGLLQYAAAFDDLG